MKTIIRFVTGLLFLTGILFLAWLTRANSRLADGVSRLEAELGRLSIKEIDRIHIVAIKEPDGRMMFNPMPEAVMGDGDVLIALGDRQHLDQLEGMAGSKA